MVSDARAEHALPFWSEQILQARRRAKMTQADLARQLNVSQSAVTDWERGRTRPRSSLWGKIEEIIGVPPSIFVSVPLEDEFRVTRLSVEERKRLFTEYYHGLAKVLEEAGVAWDAASMAYHVHVSINSMRMTRLQREVEGIEYAFTPFEEAASRLKALRSQLLPADNLEAPDILPQTG